jgi:ring-1,2-phenylacetyl-CoA epoxidase subunit PaaC
MADTDGKNRTLAEARFSYVLRLADDPLILGQRLGEWCGHAPVLEEDLALVNIALDLIGQARLLLGRAGAIEGKGRDEDTLAFFRDCGEFRNVLLVEQPNRDFGYTIARQFLYDAFHAEFYPLLASSRDGHLAGIATKADKETRYHVRHSGDWVVRLGDGTDFSHAKIQSALDELWPFTAELFEMDEIDRSMCEAGIGVDKSALKTGFDRRIDNVLGQAGLRRPEDGWMQQGGRHGRHSEHLGHVLSELQFLQRAYPGARW